MNPNGSSRRYNMYRKIVVRSAIVVAVLVVLSIVSLAVQSAMAKRPEELGLVEGRLRPCSPRPNCVCSQDTDPEHAIEPLSFEGTPAEGMKKLEKVIAAMPRTKIVSVDDNYLHAEFTSRLFRFVDDAEFAIDPASKRIQLRSASRVGYSDLGANRRRMEAIREAFDRQ